MRTVRPNKQKGRPNKKGPASLSVQVREKRTSILTNNSKLEQYRPCHQGRGLRGSGNVSASDRSPSSRTLRACWQMGSGTP